MNSNTLKKVFIAFLTMSVILSCNKIETKSGISYNFLDNDRWGVIDEKGDVIFKNDFKGSISLYNENLLVFKKENEKVFYIDEKGIESTLSYKNMTFFNDGYAFGIKDNSIPFAINTKGEEVKEIKVDKIYGFINGMSAIEINGLKGFVDNNLDIVVRPKYLDVAPFSNEGFAFVINEDGESILINKTGNEVRLPNRDYEFIHFKDGYLLYKDEDNGFGIIDIDGKQIIKTNSDWTGLTNFREGIASYQEDGLWGAVNIEGKKIIRAKYKHPIIFNEGVAAAYEVDGDNKRMKVGYINKKNDFVIKPEYDWGSIFVNGRTLIRDGKYHYIIDSDNDKAKDDYKNISIDNFLLYLIESNYTDYVRHMRKNSLNYYSVKNDYFDVERVIYSIIDELNIQPSSILGGINIHSRPNSEELIKNDIYFKEPSEILNPDFTNLINIKGGKNISDNINFIIGITFSEEIYKINYKAKENYNYSTRKYVTSRIFENAEFNDNSRISQVDVNIETSGKIQLNNNVVFKSFQEYFETNYSVIKNEKGNIEYYEISNNIKANISEDPFKVIFKFTEAE